MWNILGDGPINTSHASSTAPNLRLVEVLDDGVLAWQERALCAQTDPEAFFPEKGGSTRGRSASALPARSAPRPEYALANDERFGIWGGLSERERRKMKRRAV